MCGWMADLLDELEESFPVGDGLDSYEWAAIPESRAKLLEEHKRRKRETPRQTMSKDERLAVIREYRARYNARRKADGLCLRCKTELSTDSRSYCEKHLEEVREYQSERYLRKAAKKDAERTFSYDENVISRRSA